MSQLIISCFHIKGWHNRKGPSGQTQWLTGDNTIMLPVDITLGYPANTTGGVGVRTQACGPVAGTNTVSCTTPNNATVVPTYHLVNSYATSNSGFLAAFPAAFVKMVTVGYGAPANTDGSTSTGRLGTLTTLDFTTCPVRRLRGEPTV